MEFRSVPSLIDEALEDAALAMSQFPCVFDTKEPEIRWREFQTRHPDVQELQRWFTRRVNRAIVCGAVSGVVGIDLDHVTRGMDVLLARRIPVSPVQTLTWSRKLHLFYRHPGVRVPPAVKVLGEPIDLRGDGSYLIAPGSQIDGKFYERTAVWERRLMPVFNPQWFEVPMPNDKRPPPTSLVSTRLESVRRYIAHIVAVSGSRGHAATYRAACKAADAGLSFDEILGLMIEWNETNALPKWDIEALTHKVRDALDRTLKRKP